MNLVVIHYHLNRGGVTQVMVNHLRAICANNVAGIERVIVLYGGRKDGWPDKQVAELPLEVSLVELPALEYDSEGSPADPARLADAICSALHGLAVDDTVVQVHNHSLGKNLAVVGAIERLSEAGYALLLQIHDFAEDSRPANYLHLLEGLAGGDRAALFAALYPQGGRIHYAALNGRDLRLLEAAGVRDEALHWLPNPVAGFGELPTVDNAKQQVERTLGIPTDAHYILYPVRGIRRKNVGELVLWSALADNDVHFGLTLAPQNPLEAVSYTEWRQLSEQLRLRCHWDVGGADGVSFYENLSAADAIITTSVAEGFGMVFLEAWLANRPLVGRDLPEITADFTASGLELADLRAKLYVPRDWVDDEALSAVSTDYQSMLKDFGEDIDENEARERVHALWNAPAVDYSLLGRQAQMTVVRRVVEHPAAHEEMLALNPGMKTAMTVDRDRRAALIRANAEVVQNTYSLVAIGEKLGRVLLKLKGASAATHYPAADGQTILNAFLSLEAFRPIRVEC
ncbi:MAG TPA: hypothetical protein DCY79_16130 [Planctomycetaceae bacterium]|nr:hypothetical protein [Blastopirellula sp.]HAY81333.1 hypothetical protein [Planctomycetaceae bacterium]